ncbi:glycosyltransferase [Pluralibacter gergoviae]|uniref:glycosyltransferase n=1 Tax=Pluralibacter gergoviae TaxID=61647 RepID=UPI000650A08E|nr:glycosyltransferase [Pluralibacter gergoviae]ELN2738038.1 glycosyltransferase [Pluralibacter gergoviae]KMK33685.1 hypothetical protein ABW12_06810 [Pluralibacter gergoviae]
MNNRLVTVYIPTYNRATQVYKAINSILIQTYQHFEIIVCDDGSSDETQEVLKALKDKDDRIFIIKHDKPKGACIARNKCLEIARGEFVTGLDDDDEFTPDRLEKFMYYADKLEYTMYCSNLFYKKNTHLIKGERYTGKIDLNMISYRNRIGNQIFVKRELLQKVNGFDPNAPAWQDYDLWFRLIKSGCNCYRIPEATYIMDVSHSGPRITTSSKAYKGYKYFIEKHRSSLNRYQLNSLYLEDKTNRGEYPTIVDVINHPCFNGFIALIKRTVYSNIPFINIILRKKKGLSNS